MARKAKIALIIVAVLIGGLFGCWRLKYPYGYRHCCMIAMMGGLREYATDHGGRYPAGEGSPEASLSLLYRDNYVDSYTLSGMVASSGKADTILKSGSLLGPDSCGWHYVEGLTQADDPRIGILWCKEALGHNGNRTKDGGRQVLTVGSGIDWVPRAKWPQFLEEQKQLLLARSPQAIAGTPLVTGFVEFPDGTRTNRLDCPCTIEESTKGPDFSSSGKGSYALELVMYRAPLKGGYWTRTLSFSNLISDPVTITFTNGTPNVTNFVFRMHNVQ